MLCFMATLHIISCMLDSESVADYLCTQTITCDVVCCLDDGAACDVSDN